MTKEMNTMFRFIFATALTLMCSYSFAQEKKASDAEEEKKEEKVSYRYSAGLNRSYVVYKSATDGFFYVGSTVGHADSKDDQGQITVLAFEDFYDYKLKIFKNPVIISSEYTKTSLDAPKGLVTFDDYIIATDLDALAIFKKVEKGLPKQVGRLKIKGAKNLHSILKINSDFYISDPDVNGIFKVTNLMDPEKREIIPLTRIPSPKGMIYDSAKDALLIVSSKVNKLYEYNLVDPKKSTTYTLAPEVPKDQQKSHNGFIDLCMGNQKEIYLTNYEHNKIMIYFRDEDRPATIKEPMKYAKVFISDVRTPTSIIYDKTLNRIIFTEFYYSIVRFNKGLPPQLTDDIIKQGLDIDKKLDMKK